MPADRSDADPMRPVTSNSHHPADAGGIPRDALEQALLELVTTRLLDTPEGFGVSSSLFDAGLDSMAIMQLLLLIEESYGLWLPEADLIRENFADVRAVAALLARHLSCANGA